MPDYFKKKLRFLHSPWAFPAVLVTVIFILCCLGINGSSSGYYSTLFLGGSAKDPALLFNQPRPIRSDEWLVQSGMVEIQKAAGYPVVNKNIGLGQNMEVLTDVPTKSPFAVFKPQNLGFFVLPFKAAFALRWWFGGGLLALSFYLLFYSLFPKKKLIIALGALLILFNPFVQWWYQSATTLSIAFGLLAVAFFVKIFTLPHADRSLKKILYALGLSYTAACFVFNFYPPFLIGMAYVCLFFLLGFLYHRYFRQKKLLKKDTINWLLVGSAITITLAVLGTFYVSHKSVIQTISHTDYPGVRNIKSGEIGGVSDVVTAELRLFSSPVQAALQVDSRGQHYYTNQSEASTFISINLVLSPIMLYLISKKPRRERELADYLMIGTSLLLLLLCVRFITPFFNLPYKLLLFNKAQNERLEIALVTLGCIQIILVGMLKFKELSLKKRLVIALGSFAVFTDASLIMVNRYPQLMPHFAVLLTCGVVALSIFLMLRKKLYVYGLVLFVAFNILSSAFVHPLYTHAEAPVVENLTNLIRTKYTDKKSWITLDYGFLENIPQLAGEHSLSGVEVYPQLDLWRKLDPNQVEKKTYNRYAHVVFVSQGIPADKSFVSPQADIVLVALRCETAAKLPNLGYVLSPGKIPDGLFPCLHQEQVISYPALTLFIYSYHS